MREIMIPRMWTITQIAKYMKKQDPDTNITEYRLRKWCASGALPHVCSDGSTKLINVDKLPEYLDRIAENEARAKQDEKPVMRLVKGKE